MMDRLDKIIAGITAAGQGTFALILNDRGEWLTAAEYGKEADDSPMVGAASYGASPSANEAIQTVLDETRWVEL